MQFIYIIIGVLVVWLGVLTYFVITNKLFFNKLGKDVNGDNLIKIIEKIITLEKQNTRSINELKSVTDSIKNEDTTHIQKVGIVKFNPFEEVGGEHSFSVCLLNDNNSGVILTGLHTRDRTRVYLKEVKRGKALVELSKEEAKAFSSAIAK